ncbi:alpha/beta hydrolase fold domain-containing protein [Microbacterium sp.]|uniref:alpha/beta hydrolase fold domain-containing protein n=1 Tax=Microbacterium sp. TaxID=51671 RepID=UPI003A86882F
MTAEVVVERDLVYARLGERESRFDLYLPRHAPGPLPVVLYFHGGGWRQGSRAAGSADRLEPVARAGIAVAAVSYRFSGESLWPAQRDDAVAAVDHLRRHAARWGLDRDRVGLWGASAGGQIALMTSYLSVWPGDQPDNPIRSVVAWFPATDLAAMATDTPPEGAVLPPFVDPAGPRPDFERELVGAAPGDDATDALRAASPLWNLGASPPPTLLIHGTHDGLISPQQSVRLYEALRERGARCEALLVTGATHEDAAFDSPAVTGATAAWFTAMAGVRGQ